MGAETRLPLLLHVCCAPCATVPIQRLRVEYELTLYFYNPNIFPRSEYDLREDEIGHYARQNGLPLIVGQRDFWDFEAVIAGMEHLGEATDRCWACYRLRLEATARTCKAHGISCFTTTLSVSPHKKMSRIRAIGLELADRYRLTFVDQDFKKRDGFTQSTLLSRAAGLYRQDYCGCRYSYEEMVRRKGAANATMQRSPMKKDGGRHS
ncbi:epoxyqueuosine reductase QueH [bacterium]|nr:epoxyqueuosine reductase QueH [bacterium]